MDIDPALQAVWAIASTEACLSGSAEIRPIHFVLAVLKVLDDAFHRDAEQMGFSKEAISQITLATSDGRALLGLPEEKLTSARRRLRKALQANAKPGELKMLHRSEESRQLFQSAAKRANDGQVQNISLLHFIESLLTDLPKEAAPYLQGTDTPEKDDSVEETTKLLGKIGRDVTALAREGRLATVVGRKQEMTLLARYLQRTSKRNVLLTGEAGVGKTAIVEGLAQRLTAEDAPEFLRGWRIIQVNVADLVAGTMYRGQMEERLQTLLKEAISDPNLIVFFDEIHLVMKTGSGGGAMDIANILKPALARDDIRCIGATTTEEFERHIKSDSALMRRFQILRVQAALDLRARNFQFADLPISVGQCVLSLDYRNSDHFIPLTSSNGHGSFQRYVGTTGRQRSAFLKEPFHTIVRQGYPHRVNQWRIRGNCPNGIAESIRGGVSPGSLSVTEFNEVNVLPSLFGP